MNVRPQEPRRATLSIVLELGFLAFLFVAGSAQAQPALYFVHVDHLDTPRMIADSAGRTVWTWDQVEPFGDSPSNKSPSGLGMFEQPLRFAGQYFDDDSNLAYNNYRDYDSDIGGYKQADPIGLAGGSLSLYIYANGAPLTITDPSGLFVPAAIAGTEALVNLVGGLIVTAAAVSAQNTIEDRARTIPQPKKPACGCTCICRADADDRMAGNVKPGLPRFAFGEATADNCPKASKEAKRIATRNLRMQPKHIPCKCAGK